MLRSILKNPWKKLIENHNKDQEKIGIVKKS